MAGGGASCPEPKGLKAADLSLQQVSTPRLPVCHRRRLWKAELKRTRMQSANLTRRAALSGAAVAIVATATPIAASAAMPDDANRIWAEHAALLAELRRIDREIEAAVAKLPEWADHGPRCVDREGRFCGPVVTWPQVADVKLPIGMYNRVVRPSPHDIRVWFRHNPWVTRADYRKRMREVIARVRAQRAEEERVGLPKLIAQARAIDDRRSVIRDRLDALPASANATAAIMLFWIEEKEAFTVCEGLRKLRPMLTGLIADHTDWLIQHPRDADISLAGAPFHYWSEHV
jgi:hypothetical protein